MIKLLCLNDFLNGKLPKSFENTFSKLSDVGPNGNNVSTIN